MARHNPKRSASDFQLRQQWITAIYQYRQYENQRDMTSIINTPTPRLLQNRVLFRSNYKNQMEKQPQRTYLHIHCKMLQDNTTYGNKLMNMVPQAHKQRKYNMQLRTINHMLQEMEEPLT